jgi:hypothetical protein
MLQRHPNRPKAAAVLQSSQPRDEHLLSSALQRTSRQQIADGSPFLLKPGREGLTRAKQPLQTKTTLAIQSSGAGKPAPGAAKEGFVGFSMHTSYPHRLLFASVNAFEMQV